MTQVASSTGSAVKHSPNVGSTITRTRCGVAAFTSDGMRPNENKMSDGGRGRASLGVKVWKSSQKWSVRRSAVRSIAWLGLCGFIGGRGATIGAQLHNKFFAIIAIAHILSCKLESAFL